MDHGTLNQKYPDVTYQDIKSEDNYAEENLMINLVIIGHVDSGKSTLVGHLLFALGKVNK